MRLVLCGSLCSRITRSSRSSRGASAWSFKISRSGPRKTTVSSRNFSSLLLGTAMIAPSLCDVVHPHLARRPQPKIPAGLDDERGVRRFDDRRPIDGGAGLEIGPAVDRRLHWLFLAGKVTGALPRARTAGLPCSA